MSPPHPRGSTLRDLSSELHSSVSPAPAGIDLNVLQHFANQSRLPRTRGDRPCACPSAIAGSPSPPHPRGSTSRIHPQNPAHVVSPAPAGIDPAAILSRMQSGGLPRTRGDRPARLIRPGAEVVSPPHPRGSTYALGLVRRDHSVSPAPAGIDPLTVRSEDIELRLPRTRGDRPIGISDAVALISSPPHPRGSTREDLGHEG